MLFCIYLQLRLFIFIVVVQNSKAYISFNSTFTKILRVINLMCTCITKGYFYAKTFLFFLIYTFFLFYCIYGLCTSAHVRFPTGTFIDYGFQIIGTVFTDVKYTIDI